MKQKTETASRPATVPVLSLKWRCVLSFVLLFHVLAVFFPPFTFATATGPRNASPFAQPIMRLLRPYVDIMFLDHGYFFFAPNPGPSHLVRANLEFSDQRPPLQITLPDRSRHWPRLLYHRHFMLSEQYRETFAPPQPPREIANDPYQLADWRRARAMYELRRGSFENHLKAAHGADRVTLTRVEHALLNPDVVATQGKKITDSDTYFNLPEDNVATPLPVLGLRP